jgi:hypothetical protein
MKTLIGSAFLLLGAVALSLRSGLSQAPMKSSGSPRHAVIVELFTSEGCSDCPPADELLAQLEAKQPVAGAEVIGLEEHVDYWDHQGWRDPYSSAEWTERQREYAMLRSESIYTPEMIVDGTTGFVGSRARHSLQIIEQAAIPAKTDVSITASSAEKNKENLAVRAGQVVGAKDGDTPEVWLAITESGLHMAVTSGENSGRELRHASVLRRLQRLGAADPRNAGTSFALQRVVSLDSRWIRSNLRAVVFVQERKSKRILGAAATMPGAIGP